MSLVRRSLLLLRGWLNAVLEPAPDPRRTFAQVGERQRELLGRVQQSLAAIRAAKRRLEGRAVDLRARLRSMEQQARQSLAAGREDLARLALEWRHGAGQALQTLDTQLAELQHEEGQLVLVEHRLAAQVEGFQARLEVIAARHSTAEAQLRLAEDLTGISDDLAGLGITLEQMEQRTGELQSRAAAIDRLVESGMLPSAAMPGPAALEHDTARREQVRAVEDQLAALRHELGGRR